MYEEKVLGTFKIRFKTRPMQEKESCFYITYLYHVLSWISRNKLRMCSTTYPGTCLVSLGEILRCIFLNDVFSRLNKGRHFLFLYNLLLCELLVALLVSLVFNSFPVMTNFPEIKGGLKKFVYTEHTIS